MAYPTILYSADGEQYNSYANNNQLYPYGTQMVMQDGRKFRFTRAGGTTLVVANVQQAGINTPNHVDTTAVATAIGSRAPSTTLGATAATVNDYREGYAVVSVTPDGGSIYVIGSHAAVGSGAVATLNLAPGFALKAAWTTTSRIDLIRNPYRAVIEVPGSSLPTGPLTGVAVVALAANTSDTALSHGWLATHGPCAVETDGTLVVGQRAVTAADAGEAAPWTATAANMVTEMEIGVVMRVAADTAFSTIFLTIDK